MNSSTRLTGLFAALLAVVLSVGLASPAQAQVGPLLSVSIDCPTTIPDSIYGNVNCVIGYANSTGSYIPDSRIVREGGYEGLTSQQVYFLPAPFTERIDAEIGQIVAKAIGDLKD